MSSESPLPLSTEQLERVVTEVMQSVDEHLLIDSLAEQVLTRFDERQRMEHYSRVFHKLEEALAESRIWLRKCYIEMTALRDALLEADVLKLPILEQKKNRCLLRLLDSQNRADLGILLDVSKDKLETVTPETIGCADRIDLCKAACCTRRFSLRSGEVREGIIMWDHDQPFQNAIREDGYCFHFDPERDTCTIYENRPVNCRAYDCRRDQRIWRDFGRMLMNPDMVALVSVSQRRQRGNNDESVKVESS